MQRAIYDHVDLRVRSLALVQPFYDAFCKAIGLIHRDAGDHLLVYFRRVERRAAEALAVSEDAEHVPSQTRLAFRAESPAEVDRIAEVIRNSGGRAIEGPAAEPDYGPTYYAVFFEDPSGNRLEVCYR